MKNLYTAIVFLCITTVTQAASDNKSQKDIYDLKNRNSSHEVLANKRYMKEVLKLIPDMQEKNQLSKIRSKNEGAALQLVSGSINIYATGLTSTSLYELINVENKGIKKFFKTKNISGYFFVYHDILLSKGYPKFNGKDLERFKSQATCKSGYCSVAVITDMKLLDKHGKEQQFNKEELEKYISKEDIKNKSLEINPKLITNDYNMSPLNLVLGYGLGGNDALDFINKKRN